MIAPFLQPELEWDFRVERVVSISTSAHKYGLVYPGLGWVVWRTIDDLPEELVFDVTYLGGHMPTFALNFSRPGAQVLLQYYLFLRLGWDGYYKVQKASQDVALYLSGEIGKMDAFDLWNDGSDIPVFAWQLTPGSHRQVEPVPPVGAAAAEGLAHPGLPDARQHLRPHRAAHRGAQRPQPQPRRVPRRSTSGRPSTTSTASSRPCRPRASCPPSPTEESGHDDTGHPGSSAADRRTFRTSRSPGAWRARPTTRGGT